MNILDIVKYVFSSIGAIFLALAFYLYSDTETFLQDAITANGEVVELARSRSSESTTYRPVVKFYTNEGVAVEFTSSSGSNPPSFRVGEVVAVLYKSADPQQAKINSFFSLWGLALIFATMGGIFLLVGGSLFLYERHKRRKVAHLKRYGVPVEAKFIGVERASAVRVNGRRPYQIYAQWMNPRSNSLYVFKSDYLWFDPSDYILDPQLTVLIEADNPKKYYMDVDFLPDVE